MRDFSENEIEQIIQGLALLKKQQEDRCKNFEFLNMNLVKKGAMDKGIFDYHLSLLHDESRKTWELIEYFLSYNIKK